MYTVAFAVLVLSVFRAVLTCMLCSSFWVHVVHSCQGNVNEKETGCTEMTHECPMALHLPALEDLSNSAGRSSISTVDR